MSGSEGTMTAARRVFAPAPGHAHGGVESPSPGHRHDSGAHHHPHRASHAARTNVAQPSRTGLSLLRLSLGRRLFVAALTMAAIWAAVVAVMQ